MSISPSGPPGRSKKSASEVWICELNLFCPTRVSLSMLAVSSQATNKLLPTRATAERSLWSGSSKWRMGRQSENARSIWRTTLKGAGSDMLWNVSRPDDAWKGCVLSHISGWAAPDTAASRAAGSFCCILVQAPGQQCNAGNDPKHSDGKAPVGSTSSLRGSGLMHSGRRANRIGTARVGSSHGTHSPECGEPAQTGRVASFSHLASRRDQMNARGRKKGPPLQ